MEFCSDMRRDPYMQDRSTNIQKHFLLSFDAQNRRGYYGRVCKVCAQTPENALHHVEQTIVLEGYSDPRRYHGSTDQDLTVSWSVKSHKTDNLAPNTYLPLPIRDIKCVADLYCTKQTLVASAVADLPIIVLCFLLRPGE